MSRGEPVSLASRPAADWGGSSIARLTVWLLLGLLALEGAARAVGYLVYVSFRLPFPYEIWYLEPKMAHLAWRAQAGIGLYPDWTSYPHVANFFGPVYFGLVGLLGRLAGTGLANPFITGRSVSLVASLLTTLLLGVYLARRYGRVAGLVGAVLSLGSGPMYGFALMVRPDATAEFLGFTGYLLSGRRSLAGCLAGCALLALAVLTKQTAVIFVAASVAAPALSGEWRRAGLVLGATSACLAAAVALVSAWEPHFVASLLGESKMPWSVADWWRGVGEIADSAPDLLFFAVVGLVLWVSQRPRDDRAAVLAVAVVASSLVMVAKVGSDRNYFLSWRIIEGWAAATLWHAVAGNRPRARSALVVLLACLSLAPQLPIAYNQALSARNLLAYQRSPEGQLFARELDVLLQLAQRTDVRLLTNSGLIQLHQGERAAFVDPWLFRQMVAMGWITPTTMLRMIDSEDYLYVITTEDLFAPDYASYPFGLPMPLVERARAHYAFQVKLAGLFLYARRRGP